MSRNYSSTAVDTTLSNAAAAVATVMSVSSTSGFPSPPFLLAVDAGTASQELVLVTNVSGLNLTVERGYDSTPALDHATGAVVRHSHAAIDFRESRQHEAKTTGAHGVTGSVVGTSDAQTLTNKDLSASSNTFPANHLTATSTHTVTNKDLSAASNTFPEGTFDLGVGEVRQWAGTSDPNANWMVMDGRAISRSTYSDLYALVGTTYGTGDGSSTFNIPNATGKFPLGGSVGTTGGSATATLAEANLPSHTHGAGTLATSSGGAHTHDISRSDDVGSAPARVASGNTAGASSTSTASSGAHTHTITGSTAATGSGTAFSVQNPYFGINFVIRVA